MECDIVQNISNFAKYRHTNKSAKYCCHNTNPLFVMVLLP